MKVLFVTERFPLPLDNGGNVRTYHVLHGLCREHRVTLVSGAPPNGVDESTIRERCAAVHLVQEGRRGPGHEVLTLMRSMAAGSSFLLDRHYNRRLHETVRKASTRNDFDVIHLNHLDAMLHLPHDAMPRHVILDAHNVVSNQAITTLRSEKSSLRRLLLRRDIGRLQATEGKLAASATRVLVCSHADENHLYKLAPGAAVSVVPNGVDLEYFSMLSPPAAQNTVIFVGAMDYDPCDRAMRYFCAEILPRVRQRQKDVRIVIVGRNPSVHLQRIAAHDSSVILAGRVPDVRVVAATAAVSVVPLLSGSGTRLKILEAMAMGIPVVTTTIGLEGIEASHSVHCLVADDPQEFADAVGRLLEDRASSARMAKAARSLVVEKYSWESIANKLLHTYRNLDKTVAHKHR